MIVTKNLFDPERGVGATRDAEENSRAFQRVRNMVLVGTVIIGNNQTAILQDGGSSPPTGQGAGAQATAPVRLKLGDNIEGFRLSEIADKRVVFTNGAARVEVLLDYFRKVQPTQPQPRVAATPGQVGAPAATRPGQVGAPGAVIPQQVPNLPRRTRIPIQPNQGPES